MPNKKLTNVLTDIGLSNNQARVYLAALSLGASTPVEIARAADVKRTTVYPVLESLIHMGLVDSVVKGTKNRYLAADPSKLDALIEQRHARLKDSLVELSALKSLESGGNEIKHYEGLDSIKSVYNGLLDDVRPGDDYMIISSPDNWYKLAPKYFDEFILRRAQLDINIRCLLLDTPKGRDYLVNRERFNLKVKFLPNDKNFLVNIVIIPRKVVIHQVVPPIWSMVIENRYIVQSQQKMFELIWSALPEVP
jgi:sugar-specific transcriptional regulator TrmB